MTTIQLKRSRTMSRLSAAPSKKYDVRKHRRAVYVAVKWQRELLGDDMPAGMARNIVRAAAHFTARRFKGPHAA